MKNNLEGIFIELRNENSKYSIKILELEQELQRTIEQLEIAIKHISRLLDLESHYEDCTYHSDDDETCDCGNESNYYKPARDFCINFKDKQGEALEGDVNYQVIEQLKESAK